MNIFELTLILYQIWIPKRIIYHTCISSYLSSSSKSHFNQKKALLWMKTLFFANISITSQLYMTNKFKITQDSFNQVFTTLPHSLTLLPNPFYLPLLSHSFIHPPESVSRGVQGGGATSCQIREAPLWLIIMGGSGHPPVIFNIFDSGFYITYTNYTP